MQYDMEVKRRSAWWFLLPILFNVIGGIIAYFVLREDDPKRARDCLLLGAILTAIGIALFFIPLLIGISLMPDMYTPHMFENNF
jgi:cytochrome bd-type quinol oxidase subunit 2